MYYCSHLVYSRYVTFRPLPTSKYQISSAFSKLHQMEKFLKQFHVHRIRIALLVSVAFVLLLLFFLISIEFVNCFVVIPEAFVVDNIFYFQVLHSQVSKLQFLGPKATVVIAHMVDHRHQRQIIMASSNQGYNSLMIQHQVFYESNFSVLLFDIIQQINRCLH